MNRKKDAGLNFDFDFDFEIDELGRVIVTDLSMLEVVSGAVSQDLSISGDSGCHDNAACANDGCQY